MSMPTLDEHFLPRLVSIFYATFHPTEGPKVIYQVPEGSITDESIEPQKQDTHSRTNTEDIPSASKAAGLLSREPLFDFSSLSEYLIPKAPLCGRLVTCNARGIKKRADPLSHNPNKTASPPLSRSNSDGPPSSNRPFGHESQPSSSAVHRTYKILGFPVLLEDASRYRRNNFIFNLCFVFDGQADVRAYEPVVRKCGRVIRGLEESHSFLSNPKSLPRMYGIIEQLFEDLNSYCESFIALPVAPHTSYLNAPSKANSPIALQRLMSPLMAPNDLIALLSSTASIREEHQKRIIHEHHLRHLQPTSPKQSSRRVSSNGLDRKNSQTSLGRLSRQSSDSSHHPEIGSILSPLTSIRPERNANGSSSSGPFPSSSPSASTSPTCGLGLSMSRMPSLARSFTISPLTEVSSKAATQDSKPSGVTRSSSERQSELTCELSATQSHTNTAPNYDSVAVEAALSFSGTRRSSTTSSHLISYHEGDPSRLSDSILSLQTIDAALSNSVHALRDERSSQSHRTAFAEKREPPHGLGRTVRDAVNLKLFPVYSNPPPVNDWDVPVALLDLGSRVDGNWDLTMTRIFPFIDGVNHVKRISQLADADLGLTRLCMEHLLYYGCIIMVDIFQYFNMYTVRPAIARMAGDEAMGRECATYVTRPGYPLPSYPELLRLYSLLRAGKNLHDWIEDNDTNAKGIDVRRFVSFGVIQGFLRRVHRYPIYLASSSATSVPEDVVDSSRFDTSAMSTVRNSPMLKSAETNSRLRREQSGSREPRDRRVKEPSAVSTPSSAFPRTAATERTIESSAGRSRTPNYRRAGSEMGSTLGNGKLTDSASQINLISSSSPTKRTNNRNRHRLPARHTTATVMDVANVTFETDDRERPWNPGLMARSPRKKAGSLSAHGLASALSERTAGNSHAKLSYKSTMVVPPGLAEMLDGTHNDDELCVTFGVSWPELERMLIYIGTLGRDDGHVGLGDDSEDEGVPVSGSRMASGWSRANKMSSQGSNLVGRSGGSGGGNSSAINPSRYGGIHESSTGYTHFSGAGGWGLDSEEAMSGGGGWPGLPGMSRQARELGDLGRVKILLQ